MNPWTFDPLNPPALEPFLVVFDLDGTLVDSLQDLTDASNELLAHYGAAALEDDAVGGMVGEGAATLVARLLRARDLDVPHGEALTRFLALYDRRLLNHTRPYDGIPEALEELSAHAKLAVLTNKPLAATNRILSGLGMRDRFRWIVGGDSPQGRKPSPAGLQMIAESAAQPIVETVLVGDSAVDVETARNAGARVCVARYGFGFRNCRPDLLRGDELLADDPRQLPALLLGALRSDS
jgi:phosphoglycolate phosphatase